MHCYGALAVFSKFHKNGIIESYLGIAVYLLGCCYMVVSVVMHVLWLSVCNGRLQVALTCSGWFLACCYLNKIKSFKKKNILKHQKNTFFVIFLHYNFYIYNLKHEYKLEMKITCSNIIPPPPPPPPSPYFSLLL